MKHMRSYSHVFYLRGGLFDVEHDGVRGTNRHYSNMVDMSMKYYLQGCDAITPGRVTYIDASNLEERIEIILPYAQDTINGEINAS